MDPVILVFGCLAVFFIFKLFTALGDDSNNPGAGGSSNNEFDALRDALSGNSRKSQAGEASSKEKQARSTDVAGDTNVVDMNGEVVVPKPVRASSPAGQTLLDADPTFDEKAFVEGAKAAYEMIVEAFADGDMHRIRTYLGDNVFNAFNSAVEQRKSSEQTMELTFVGIDTANVVDADVTQERLVATTEFTSNQVRVTRDKEANIVEGDPNRIDLVRDRWTFARKRNSKDPNWVLVATS